MKTVSRITTLFFVLIMFGCQEYGVDIRIENVSSHDFDDISINNVSFGPLESNNITEYVPFENIYKSEFFQVEIDGEIIKLIPEEFKEDEYFSSGQFKFLVDIVQDKKIILNFIEE